MILVLPLSNLKEISFSTLRSEKDLDMLFISITLVKPVLVLSRMQE